MSDPYPEFPPAESRPEPETESGPAEGSRPQFGLVDVVEAFTALRHECRVQTRENRQLADVIRETADRLDSASRQLTSTARSGDDDAANLRLWVDHLIEIDLSLTRAVEAAGRPVPDVGSGTEGEDDFEAFRRDVTDRVSRLGPVRRWFLTPVLQQLEASIEEHAERARRRRDADTTTEGLRMVVGRVREMMSAHHIQRIDTLGLPFDGTIMNAVERVRADDRPGGTVARQLSPAYRWGERLVRYADVCVTH